MKYRLIFITFVLFVFALLLFANKILLLSPNKEITSTPQSPAINQQQKTFQSRNDEQIIKRVQQVPYVTNMAFVDTKDGKLAVTAMAEISPANEWDEKRLAREIAFNYILAVYRSRVPIAQASIYVMADQDVVLAASLDDTHQRNLALSAMTGSGISDLVTFLKENQVRSTEPEKNTWIYEDYK